MVDAGGLRTEINSFFHFFRAFLAELPWKIVASPMQLKVLFSLETLVADFADESVGCH